MASGTNAMDLSYPLAGFAVGAIVGLTGVGGGSLMTPLLVAGFGVPPVTAVGTDLLFAGLTKAGGAIAHGRRRNVGWTVAGRLALGSIPATVLALALLAFLPPAGPATKLLVSTVLGLMLLLTAASLVFRAPLLASAQAAPGTGWRRHAALATVAAGAFIGFASTLSSIGAGAVGVTVLVALYPALAMTRVVGTDIAHAVPLALIAGAGHAVLGHVDYAMLALLLAGSLPGIALGSRLSGRVPERLLRGALAALLAFAGGKLVLA